LNIGRPWTGGLSVIDPGPGTEIRTTLEKRSCLVGSEERRQLANNRSRGAGRDGSRRPTAVNMNGGRNCRYGGGEANPGVQAPLSYLQRSGRWTLSHLIDVADRPGK